MTKQTRGNTSILQAVSSLLAGGLVVFLTLQGIDATCSGDGNDLDSYLSSARALLNGGNPYATGSPFPYIYPLFLALVITPLTALPCPAAALTWTLLGWVSLAGTLVIIRRHLLSPLPFPWLVGLCLVLFDIIQNNVVNGQVNLLVLFLCILGFDLSCHHRHLPAALALGAAAAIKLTPLVLLGFLLARGQWLTAGIMVLVFLLLGLAPGFLPGIDVWDLYGDYVRDFLAESLADEGSSTGHVVFSIVGILRQTGLPLNSLVSLLVLLLVPGSLMGWDALSFRRKIAAGKGHHDLRSFSLFMLIPLFVVPMSEVHHLIQTLPGFVCLVAMSRVSGTRRGWILAAVSLGTYLAGSLFWREGPLYFTSLVLLLWGLLSGFSGQDQEGALGE